MPGPSCPMHHRRGSIYVALLGVASIVTVVGLSALMAARLQRRAAESGNDVAAARLCAQSAVDFALFWIGDTPLWRATLAHDTWGREWPLGNGTFSWRFVDEADGILTNDPAQPVRLYARGTVGDAVRLCSVLIEATSESDTTTLMSYEAMTSTSDAHVHDTLWWSQYFKPAFDAGTLSWNVTRVEFMARRDHNDDTTTLVQLRLPLADRRPSETVVDEIAVPQLSLTSVYQWVEKSFTNARGLLPTQGLCLTFITYDANSCQLLYRTGGVAMPNASLAEGNPVWQAAYADKSLLYRIHGTVVSTSTPVLREWRCEVRP